MVSGVDPNEGSVTLYAPAGYRVYAGGVSFAGTFAGAYPTDMEHLILWDNNPTGDNGWLFDYAGLGDFAPGNGVNFSILCYPIRTCPCCNPSS